MQRLIAAVCVTLLLVQQAWAHDDRWHDEDTPAVKDWYSKLLQPDTITTAYNSEGAPYLNGNSCCGQADAYYVDVNVVYDRQTGTSAVIATIDDDRNDKKLNDRAHEDNGTQYTVPPNKVVGRIQRVGNPTGHAILFLSAPAMVGEDRLPRDVMCFVDNGDI